MDLFKITYDTTSGISISVSTVIVCLFVASIIIWLFIKWKFFGHRYSEFEINEAQIGIGQHKIKIRPSDEDLQIAYQLWVELSTRKIGIKIDEENDVISELYNSWYEFFKIARDLIKSIPVRKVRANDSTQKIVELSFKILNEALRPHLTMWQARFRHWYETEIAKENNKDCTPQDVQKKFPDHDELITDMLRVNQILISYKETLERLIHIE